MSNIFLTSLEVSRLYRFAQEDHKGCGRHSKLSISQEEFAGLGVTTTATCEYCKKSENITDVDAGVFVNL